MAVRTRLLAHGVRAVGAGTGQIYEVPVDRTAIVKFVTLYSTTGAVIQLVHSRAANSVVVISQQVSAGTANRFDLYLVMQEFDKLVMGPVTPADISYTVSGALLLGDPA